MTRKKSVCLFELTLIVMSLFAFSYLISDRTLSLVSAQSGSFKGCCLKTKEGAICQNIQMFQADLCKSSLIGNSCSVVDQCKLGCCYSSNSGTCALRAPKEQCLANGGNWSNDASCNIPQCQLGCCVIGDQASLTNSRECTLLSNKFDFEKKFVQISPGENCDRFVGLEKKGACLSDSGDFSGEKRCSFTTKKNCRGEFVSDYLCTADELNTLCRPSKKTTCVDGKDQVYFLDSCGNIANVYDASKIDDQNYWEKPIDPKDSCAKEGVGCGNCNYLGGSVCDRQEQGVMQRPTFGDYVCKSLHCGERKHGESWCVYDFNPNSGIAPVGSRHFVASCFEGKISIEGCADFNQEICAQSTDTSFSFTEAKCLINDWRSCINANDANSYSEVKSKCDENPQCIMFNELYGEENLRRSDGEFFAGFNPALTNSQQGAVDNLGKDQNKVLAHCVPRFTPGFQFWTTTSQIVGSDKKQKSYANYGGSNEETNAICSLGSFTCVSKIQRKCKLSDNSPQDIVLCSSTGGISALAGNPECDPWYDTNNWECNINGATTTIPSKDLPALMAAMNARCSSLGSCGTSTNIQGKVNTNFSGFSVRRIRIDASGKQRNVSSEKYVLSSEQISSLSKSTSPISRLDQLKSFSEGLSAERADSAGTYGNIFPDRFIDLEELIKGADIGQGDLKDFQKRAGMVTGLLGLVAFKGIGSVAVGGIFKAGAAWGSSGVFSSASLKGIGASASWAAVGAMAGYAIGTLILRNNPHWSPGRGKEFMNAIIAIGAALGATLASILASSCSAGPWLCVAGVIIAAMYAFYESCIDNEYKENEYYIMQFTCEAWQPPMKGDCSVCNDDVRPCSEYRCKSLGNNCHYFIENGEPGYCASINEIWSAQISPWQEILTSGNQYTSVQRNGFRIVGSFGGGIEAWQSLTFGITTDKPATCRIDFERTPDYDHMKYEMLSSINPNTGKVEGTHHQVILNAYSSKSSTNTIGLVQGEKNEYYIRCRNFAGQINEAEFAVQIKVKEGPDLTPPELRRFSPETKSFLKQGTNSTNIILYLNEPAECRFDYEYDAFSGPDGYAELRQEMFCLNSKESAFLGEWKCFAKLENLTQGKNTLYFRCKDQPDLEGQETTNYKRNVNFASEVYELNVCQSGLEISLLNTNTLIEEKNFTLSVSTYGCLGDAICSFRIKNYSDLHNIFFNTGKRIHSQLLTLPQGEHEIEVSCEDEAKNVANKTFSFIVHFDETPPKALRILNLNGKIEIVTDEPAECVYETNKTLGCNFDFKSKTTTYLSETHSFNSNSLEEYFIKCRDKKLNVLPTCSIIVKPIKK